MLSNLMIRLDNGTVFTLRTSGTEPKIKWYSEMKGTEEKETRTRLGLTIHAMIQQLLQPALNSLIPQAK